MEWSSEFTHLYESGSSIGKKAKKPLFPDTQNMCLYDQGKGDVKMDVDAFRKYLGFISTHCQPTNICLEITGKTLDKLDQQDILGPFIADANQGSRSIKAITIHHVAKAKHIPPLGPYDLRNSLKPDDDRSVDRWIDDGMHVNEEESYYEDYKDDIVYSLAKYLIHMAFETVSRDAKPIKVISRNENDTTEEVMYDFERGLLRRSLHKREQLFIGRKDEDAEQVALAHKEAKERKKYVIWVSGDEADLEQECNVCGGKSTLLSRPSGIGSECWKLSADQFV
ncbi:hypothetical protein I302_101753 [Kwoniella bestiolae CBS 10118]|uniref:Uncharacterized protein n=1 Tax=Kwoniella bestiolae CBS 10118 TaxID=1296100 RepID=A0A1B9GD53_9TREE|nr:hypothetical protein I302_00431 [Kwoniella bestiolae CBS 10118]OCF28941.1 hypothetical protein I302_00431 [Kwoniella bestiolae CBS 10118]